MSGRAERFGRRGLARRRPERAGGGGVRRLLAALVAAALAGGVPAGCATAGRGAADCTLAIRVLGADTREAMRGAQVTVWMRRNRDSSFLSDHMMRRLLSTQTGADGCARVAVPPADYDRYLLVQAEYPGCSPDVHPVVAGKEECGAFPIELALGPGVALAGRVADAAGAPAAGARIRLWGWVAGGKRGEGDRLERPAAIQEAVADAAGRFRFAGLCPGVHQVQVESGGRGFAVAEVTVPATAELPLQLTPGRSVRRRLVDGKSGAPLGAAEIGVGRPGGWRQFVTTDECGELAAADVPSGEVMLFVLADDGRMGCGYVDDRGNPADIVPVDFDREAPEERKWINGRVFDAAGAPVAGGQVSCLPGVWESEELSEYDARFSGTVISLTGRFRYDLRRAEGLFGCVALCRGKGTGRSGLWAFDDLKSEQEIVIRLENPAQVEGVVEEAEGRPVAGVPVWAGAEEYGGAGFGSAWRGCDPFTARAARTDEHGRFALNDLPAGPTELRVRVGEWRGLVGYYLDLAPGDRRRGLRLRLPRTEAR